MVKICQKSSSKSLSRLEYYFQKKFKFIRSLKISLYDAILYHIDHEPSMIGKSKSWHEQLVHLAIFRSKSIDFLERISPVSVVVRVIARVCDETEAESAPPGGRLFSLKVIIRRVKTSMRAATLTFLNRHCARNAFFSFFLSSLHPFYFFVRPWPRSTITGNDSANWLFRRNNVSA